MKENANVSQEEKNDRVERAKNDLKFFARTYFSGHLSEQPSAMHEELYRQFEEIIFKARTRVRGGKMAHAAPRGHAKSTLATLILPLWCIAFEHRRFIGVISDTREQAEEFLEGIKSELETNETLRKDFGEACGRGKPWRARKFVTNNAVRVTGWGKQTRIRGARYGSCRPDLVICDDLENDVNIDSPEQREKDRRWFFKAVMKIGGKYSVYIVIGTILHYDSLLARLLIRPGWTGKKWKAVIRWSSSPLWENWERIFIQPGNTLAEEEADAFYKKNREEMLKGTRVLWPEMESYYDLMKIRISDGPAYFDSEKQNEPVNPDDCLFQEDWFSLVEEETVQQLLSRGDYKEVYCAVDPSMGHTSRKSDPSAILIGGVQDNGVVDILEADIKKRYPDAIMEDLFQYHEMYRIDRVVIEEVQFQELFKDQVVREGAKRRAYLPVQGIRPIVDKTLRVSKLQPIIKNGLIRFRRRDRILLDQLKYFPKADHDDGPDALEMLFSMISTGQNGPRIRRVA